MSDAAGPGSPSLVPELRELVDQVEVIRHHARDLVAGLRRDQLAWRPAADRWTIADCLEHLTRTAEVSFALFDPVVERMRERGWTRGKPFRPGPLERWMLAGMEPPPRHKLRVKAALAPVADRDAAAAVDLFFTTQDDLQRRLHAINDLDLRRIKVPSPVFPWLKYRLGFAFAFLVAHERRHLWQAGQVRAAPRFPT